MERIINALKKDVDAGLLTAAKTETLSKADVAAISAAKDMILSDNQLIHVRFHVESYAKQQESLKMAQTVLGLLAAAFPAATARLSGNGKITLCLVGEKPLEPDDTGIILRVKEEAKP